MYNLGTEEKFLHMQIKMSVSDNFITYIGKRRSKGNRPLIEITYIAYFLFFRPG